MTDLEKAKAIEALEPISDELNRWLDSFSDAMRPPPEKEHLYFREFRVSDLRRASEALAVLKSERGSACASPSLSPSDDTLADLRHEAARIGGEAINRQREHRAAMGPEVRGLIEEHGSPITPASQGIADALAMLDELAKAGFTLFPTDKGGEPIPMVLHCPACGLQHIDEPEFGLAWSGGSAPEPEGEVTVWDNPPHRSHLCHGCGHIWRPADVPTTGVATVQTRGKGDSPIAAAPEKETP